MCQYELWVYQKCFSTPSTPHASPSLHQTYFRVAKCYNSPQCVPPAPRADLQSTTELPVQMRDRYCSTCLEVLQNAMGGIGERCWPCGEEHWMDVRMCKGIGVADLEAWNGMDKSVESGSGVDSSRARQQRFKYLARNWDGWREWGAIS